MKRYRELPDRVRKAYRFFGGWYLIWFAVGLFFVGLNLPPLFGPWEDFLFIFLAAIVLLLDAIRRMGWPSALLAFLWVAALSGAVETLGTLTGFPFGSYLYTDAFGPRLLGVLPLAIPFAWWVVLLPLQVIFVRLGERNWFPSTAVPPLVGLCAALVDLALEPVATLERGYWMWQSSGLWYGVPWTNFLGWFLTATLLSAGLQWLCESVFRRAYGWETPSAHMIPLGILTSVMLTFLLASLLAGLWLAAGVALLVVAGLLRAMRLLGRFSLTALLGR